MNDVMKTIRLAFYTVAGVAVFAVLVFWPAGRVDWLAGWVYVGIVAFYFLVNLVYLQRVNPDLIEARMRMAKGTKR